MKMKKLAAAMCAAALSLTAVSFSAFAADTGVKIDETNFPDETFRGYVKKFDTDENGIFSASEIASVKKIDVSAELADDEDKIIKSLEGIENFTSLTYLDCSYHQITELNISKNTALTYLDCSYNGLITLDVSKNTALTELRCSDNELTELDISNNTALTYLDCGWNSLPTLDISNNTALTDLDCGFNELTTLDVSECTALTYLDCSWNSLSTLDVRKNTKLTSLSCNRNLLTELDVSKNIALTDLHCGENEFTELDVKNNTALISLWCIGGQLKTLDVSKNTGLTNLWCYGNKLTELDVSKNTALTELWCSENQITELNISKNTELEELVCDENKLTKLDISKNTALNFLSCYFNQLTELDISNNPILIVAYTKGDYETDETPNGAVSKGYGNTITNENGISTFVYYFMSWDESTKIITNGKTHTHTWDPGKVTTPATCKAAGVKTFTCTVCGTTKTETIAKLGHSYTSKVVAPTYAAQGYTKHTCSRCGNVYNDNYKAKKTVKKLTAKTTYTCTTNAVRINWNKLSGVTGYKIFRYDEANKKWVAVKAIYDPNATNYKISGLKSGKVYKFRVKAFVKENGKFYFGESCSTISTATRPNTTTVTKANKTSTAVRLFWKKTTCTGYRILRYDSAKKKWVRVTAVGSSATTQYKISGLKKNTTYKFKVQPYVKVGSKVIDGAASAVFTVKTTK